MKKTILLFALLLSGLCFSQAVNDYKYIIVPERFSFQKSDNQYELNKLTKMMFEKYGFEVYYTKDKLPDELALDRCKALYADVINDSGLLRTNILITLKDCHGAGIFTSQKGSSKEKTFKTAYTQALREASQSLNGLNYKYSGKETVKAAAQQLPGVASEIKHNDVQLMAKPTANGYDLVDASQKTVLKMYKTSQAESYSAQSDTKNGVVFRKNGEWFFEYYQNDKLVSEKLNIRF